MANLNKIGSDGQTNQVWRDRIDTAISKINRYVGDVHLQLTIATNGDVSFSTPVDGVDEFLSSSYSSYQETVQAAIDYLPKDLGGGSLTFKFEDGTHTFSDSYAYGSSNRGLFIDHFANGNVYFVGNTTTITDGKTDNEKQTGIDEEKLVVLTDVNGHINYKGLITLENNSAFVNISGLEFNTTATTGGASCVFNRGTNALVENCTFVGNAIDGSSKGVFCSIHSDTHVRYSSFSNLEYIIQGTEGAELVGRANYAFSPHPAHYAYSALGSKISIGGNIPYVVDDKFITATGGTMSVTNETHTRYNVLNGSMLLNDTTVTVATDGSCTSNKNINGYDSWNTLGEFFNNCPKNLNGKYLQINFANGTHNIATNIHVEGFVAGDLWFYGVSDHGATLASVAAGEGEDNMNQMFHFDDCKCDIRIGTTGKAIDFMGNGETTMGLLRFSECSSIHIDECHFDETTGNNNAVRAEYNCNIHLTGCRFDNVKHGVRIIYNSTAYVQDCTNVSDNVQEYGVYAQHGSRIGIAGSLFINGDSADYKAQFGSIVIPTKINGSDVSNSNAVIVNAEANGNA